MLGDVYAKTDKGREEIATRKYRVPARLRALLLLIDGQRTMEALAGNFGLSGQTGENAAALLQDGFIELVAAVAPPPAPPPVAQPAPPAPEAVSAPRQPPAAPVSLHDIYSRRRH